MSDLTMAPGRSDSHESLTILYGADCCLGLGYNTPQDCNSLITVGSHGRQVTSDHRIDRDTQPDETVHMFHL